MVDEVGRNRRAARVWCVGLWVLGSGLHFDFAASFYCFEVCRGFVLAGIDARRFFIGSVEFKHPLVLGLSVDDDAAATYLAVFLLPCIYSVTADLQLPADHVQAICVGLEKSVETQVGLAVAGFRE